MVRGVGRKLMGKKKAASSAAAAMLLPEHLRGGTFTSLSDITRKVLDDSTEAGEANETDAWTASGLLLTKRVMKKDEVTRAKGIADLRKHVQERNKAPESTELVASFEPIFRRILTEDPSSPVSPILPIFPAFTNPENKDTGTKVKEPQRKIQRGTGRTLR